VENDDCAVIDAGERYLVATTDMLHRKADFPDIMNPWQMGWMAVAVNLSDIAAMGAQPAGVLIAAACPKKRTSISSTNSSRAWGLCRILRHAHHRRRHRFA